MGNEEAIEVLRYRKKPVEIDAIQWDLQDRGDNEVAAARVIEWGARLDIDMSTWTFQSNDAILIDTLEGTMRAEPGDWIIRGVAGECYLCKPDIFDATYEPVDPA